MKAGRRGGSTLVVVVSALTALVLFAGLSVDVGYWHARRASAQAVADTAVVSAIGSWDDAAGTSGTFATEKAFVEQRVRQTLSANDIDPARFTITVTKHPTRDDPISVALDGSIDVPVFFTAVTGRTSFAVKIRSVAEASDVLQTPIPCAIIGINFVDVGGGGNSALDSTNSLNGPYTPTNTITGSARAFDRANAQLCSNGDITYNGGIDQFGGGAAVDSVRVNGGAAFVNGQLKAGNEIRTSPGTTVLGGTQAPATVPPVNLPPAVLPPDILTTNDNRFITGDFNVAALNNPSQPRLTTKGTPNADGKTIFIPAGGTYYFENVEILSSNSRIVLTGNPALAGKTNIFVNGAFTANGGIIAEAANVTARDLLITATGSNSGPKSELTIGGNVTVFADIYAPAQNVNITGNANFMGRVQALGVRLHGNADFTFDESLGLSVGQGLVRVVRPHLTE